MDNNGKNYNLYVLFSTFARQLVETFIPLILYKFGFSLKEVIFYFFLANLFCLIFTRPCISLSKKYSNKLLAYLGIIFFAMLQLTLQHIYKSFFYLVLVALFYSLYRRCYWVSRRFYSFKIVKKDNISSTYSITIIVNQLGVIFSAYIGSILLDYVNVFTLTIVAMIIFLLSTIFLEKMEFQHEKNDIKLDFIKTIKQIPFSNLYLIASFELLNTIKFFITLYIFIYVKNTYQMVGILSVISNLATIIFIYLYGKKINGTKNYLKFSFAFVCLILFLKCNVNSIWLLLISFLEGIACKMQEVSISKEVYTLSKKFEYNNYNLVYENVLNAFRTFILFICLFMNDLKLMIYMTLLFMFLGVCFSFKQIDENYFKGE